MKLELVFFRYPCAACAITQELVREIADKVCQKTGEKYVLHIIEHPRDICKIEGIEVEKLPAILINGEQISAGNLISTKQLLSIMEELGEGAE